MFHIHFFIKKHNSFFTHLCDFNVFCQSLRLHFCCDCIAGVSYWRLRLRWYYDCRCILLDHAGYIVAYDGMVKAPRDKGVEPLIENVHVTRVVRVGCNLGTLGEPGFGTLLLPFRSFASVRSAV